MKTFDQTVQTASGSAAASVSDTPAGTGSSWPAGTSTCSAYPPPDSSAQTSSPTDHPSTPGPTAAIIAAALQAEVRRGARRRGVPPLALEQVGPVHRGGRHPHEHLARAGGGGVGDLGPGQHLGSAGFADRDRVHAPMIARRPAGRPSRTLAIGRT